MPDVNVDVNVGRDCGDSMFVGDRAERETRRVVWLHL